MVPTSFVKDGPNLGVLAMNTRPLKRPPNGKQKLSRVTSGYGGLMIPFGRIRMTQKNGGYIGVA